MSCRSRLGFLYLPIVRAAPAAINTLDLLHLFQNIADTAFISMPLDQRN